MYNRDHDHDQKPIRINHDPFLIANRIAVLPVKAIDVCFSRAYFFRLKKITGSFVLSVHIFQGSLIADTVHTI